MFLVSWGPLVQGSLSFQILNFLEKVVKKKCTFYYDIVSCLSSISATSLLSSCFQLSLIIWQLEPTSSILGKKRNIHGRYNIKKYKITLTNQNQPKREQLPLHWSLSVSLLRKDASFPTRRISSLCYICFGKWCKSFCVRRRMNIF